MTVPMELPSIHAAVPELRSKPFFPRNREYPPRRGRGWITADQPLRSGKPAQYFSSLRSSRRTFRQDFALEDSARSPLSSRTDLPSITYRGHAASGSEEQSAQSSHRDNGFSESNRNSPAPDPHPDQLAYLPSDPKSLPKHAFPPRVDYLAGQQAPAEPTRNSHSQQPADLPPDRSLLPGNVFPLQVEYYSNAYPPSHSRPVARADNQLAHKGLEVSVQEPCRQIAEEYRKLADSLEYLSGDGQKQPGGPFNSESLRRELNQIVGRSETLALQLAKVRDSPQQLTNTDQESGTGRTPGGSHGVNMDGRKRRGHATSPVCCNSCNRTDTPEWRRGPDGARTLCNACGLHYAKEQKRKLEAQQLQST